MYVARYPKDVIVSYYFHHRLMKGQSYTGEMETFARYFMHNEGIYINHTIIVNHFPNK